jgi:hypothetical protein
MSYPGKTYFSSEFQDEKILVIIIVNLKWVFRGYSKGIALTDYDGPAYASTDFLQGDTHQIVI